MKVYNQMTFDDHRQIVNFLNSSSKEIKVVSVTPVSRYTSGCLVNELILIYITEETNE